MLLQTTHPPLGATRAFLLHDPQVKETHKGIFVTNFVCPKFWLQRARLTLGTSAVGNFGNGD